MTEPPSSHRRSRSAMVQSFLTGGSSKDSASQNATPSPRHSVHGGSLHGSSSHLSTAGIPAEAQGRRGSKTSSVRLPSANRSVTSEAVDEAAELTHTTSSVGPSGGPSTPNQLQKVETKSVDETVKTFRLYEALRSGDTAFISKTLRTPSNSSDAESSDTNLAAKSQILHLAVQCAEIPVIEYILLHTSPTPGGNLPYLDVNGRDPTTGNTPLHLATLLARQDVITLLLSQSTINDSLHNYQGRAPIDLARSPAIYEKLDLARSVFIEEATASLLTLIAQKQYPEIEKLLENDRVKGLLDVNAIEAPILSSMSDRPSSGKDSLRKHHKSSKEAYKADEAGSTLLHEAAKNKDTQLIQILLLHGADPFRRDKKGKLPQDVTKDEKVKAVLKKSPAAAHAQRGIEEKAILGGGPGPGGVGVDAIGEQGREMKGYLKKWTNYTGGWKLRWFVLEDGVLSYYKHQDDIGSACRGAINMRIARLHMDPQDKQKFEIHGKSSVRYHLKANHVVEAKRWYWTLNNAIQWAKDEAKEEEKRKGAEAERMDKLKAITIQQHNQIKHQRNASTAELNETLQLKREGSLAPSSIADFAGHQSEAEFSERAPGANMNDGDSDSEAGDDQDGSEANFSKELPTSDALALAANSARLQLDLLAQVCLALQFQRQEDPNTTLGDKQVSAALEGYEAAVLSLKKLIGDVFKMGKERDRYWKNRLAKEQSLRKVWEENMQKLAIEHEALEGEMGMQREKRKKAKKVLREVLREREQASGVASAQSEPDQFKDSSEAPEPEHINKALGAVDLDEHGKAKAARRSFVSTKSKVMEELYLNDSSEEDDEEFFDAVDAGEVEVVSEMPRSPPPEPVKQERALDVREKKLQEIKPSCIGYEDPPRQRLILNADDRPKISLWGILKSMIGKDMTKMTLPVSFNECTSLLQRVAEDMEYTNLLDEAADRSDSTERMVYVAAFAASEYSSTIDRVAKPFNPLLGETYEYVRPDKGYRFFVEQVSHHPPIGAAYAEAPKWDYWGESAVKSKFYGKSFDINPLGTWFLRLRPAGGKEELYTWKKVTTSVVGIITGSPTIDNYGLMEITNHTTGDKCLLDFKPRGWTVSTAYKVTGKILDSHGTHRWTVGGRWNDKIYARRSTGSSDDDDIAAPGSSAFKKQAAFLIWENHPRPPMPFNLTPFAVTLNALPERLKPILCPTDTRLRPDQRAMEEGKYDFAAEEKNRLEEKQRAKRKERETMGEEHEPRWFCKSRCQTTGEEFWEFNPEYWKMREEVSTAGGKWKRVEDIF